MIASMDLGPTTPAIMPFGELISRIFLDLSKEFDTLEHEIIFQKRSSMVFENVLSISSETKFQTD